MTDKYSAFAIGFDYDMYIAYGLQSILTNRDFNKRMLE